MKILDKIKEQLPYWLELLKNTSNKIAMNKMMNDLKKDHRSHIKNIKLHIKQDEKTEYRRLLHKDNKKK